MEHSEGWLTRVAENHEALTVQAAETAPDPVAVTYLATAVLAHGFIEEQCLFPARSLVDPVVIDTLRREHEQIAEDVALLRSLGGAAGDRDDREALAASLLARLRAHVEREQRIVYEPLRSGHRGVCAK